MNLGRRSGRAGCKEPPYPRPSRGWRGAVRMGVLSLLSCSFGKEKLVGCEPRFSGRACSPCLPLLFVEETEFSEQAYRLNDEHGGHR